MLPGICSSIASMGFGGEICWLPFLWLAASAVAQFEGAW
jgi:hypothetical protein